MRGLKADQPAKPETLTHRMLTQLPESNVLVFLVLSGNSLQTLPNHTKTYLGDIIVHSSIGGVVIVSDTPNQTNLFKLIARDYD